MGEIMMTDKRGLCVRCGEPEKKHRPEPGCLHAGWTNYETWAVKLWMDNDEGSYNYWREAAQEAWENPAENQFIDSRHDRARLALMERLEDEHDENMPEELQNAINGTFYAVLLHAALSEVNWYEIAESLLDDVETTEPKEASAE